MAYQYGTDPLDPSEKYDNRRGVTERRPGVAAETEVDWSAGNSALVALNDQIGRLEKIRHVDKPKIWLTTPESRWARHLTSHVETFLDRLHRIV